jgi:hypothetical protein
MIQLWKIGSTTSSGVPAILATPQIDMQEIISDWLSAYGLRNWHSAQPSLIHSSRAVCISLFCDATNACMHFSAQIHPLQAFLGRQHNTLSQHSPSSFAPLIYCQQLISTVIRYSICWTLKCRQSQINRYVWSLPRHYNWFTGTFSHC